MNVQAVSALLAALLIIAIGLSVLLRSRRDKMYTTFAAFTFTVSAWHLCTFIHVATGSTLVQWLAMWAAATIPVTAIAFFRSFLAQPSIGGRRKGPRVTIAWTLLAYIALIYSAIVHPITDELWFEVPFGAYVFGGMYRCVYDMFMQYRNTAKRVERIRVGYLTLGGFVATTLALTGVLPHFSVAWPTVGNVLGILYLYFNVRWFRYYCRSSERPFRPQNSAFLLYHFFGPGLFFNVVYPGPLAVLSGLRSICSCRYQRFLGAGYCYCFPTIMAGQC